MIGSVIRAAESSARCEPSPAHRQTAGYRNGLPGDVLGVAAGEESDEPRIVVGLAEPPQRDRLLQSLHELRATGHVVGERLKERGLCRSRANSVDPDTVPRVLARDRLRKRDHATLAGGVDGLAARPD